MLLFNKVVFVLISPLTLYIGVVLRLERGGEHLI